MNQTRLHDLLMAHHAVEARLMALIRVGGLTRATWTRHPLVRQHDQLEQDILFLMVEMTQAEIDAAIDAYEAQGGWL